MTCREFEHRATSLTLWELSQAQDQQILDHAGECQKCAAGCNSSERSRPRCKRLQARDVWPARLAPMWNGRCSGHSGKRRPGLYSRRSAHGFTPIAMRLSRFFEVGAYVAVAAAIVIGLFLGVRLLEKRSVNLPVQSQVAQPSASSPSVVAESNRSSNQRAVSRSSVNRLRTRHVRSASQSNPDTS